MRPFLLSFVDTQGFKIIAVAFLIFLGLAALGAIILLVLLAKAGLRRWQRRNMQASRSDLFIDSLVAVLMTLPAVLVGVIAIITLVSTVWLSEYRGRQWQQLAIKERKQEQEASASEARFQEVYQKQRCEQLAFDSSAWPTSIAKLPLDTASTKPDQGQHDWDEAPLKPAKHKQGQYSW